MISTASREATASIAVSLSLYLAKKKIRFSRAEDDSLNLSANIPLDTTY
jgi:hypothetical protein